MKSKYFRIVRKHSGFFHIKHIELIRRKYKRSRKSNERFYEWLVSKSKNQLVSSNSFETNEENCFCLWNLHDEIGCDLICEQNSRSFDFKCLMEQTVDFANCQNILCVRFCVFIMLEQSSLG